jgi:hypothetical protein
VVEENEMRTVRTLRRAVADHVASDLRRNDLTGIGIGYKTVHGISTGELCLKFLVRHKLPLPFLAPGTALPASVRVGHGHFVTDVEEALRPQAPLINVPSVEGARFAGPMEPVIRGGISGANDLSFYGTLGCCYRSGGRTSGPADLFVSCNHVLASYNLAPLGEPIRSPALYQGRGIAGRTIGALAMFIPIRFGGINRFDSAIGRVMPGTMSSAEIVASGMPLAAVDPSRVRPGQRVFKSGSGSGRTAGHIVAVHATVKVDYWPLGALGRNTVFTEQIVTGPMGSLGDSGAVLLDEENRQLGLLFAGTPTHTYYNYLATALAAFGI